VPDINARWYTIPLSLRTNTAAPLAEPNPAAERSQITSVARLCGRLSLQVSPSLTTLLTPIFTVPAETVNADS